MDAPNTPVNPIASLLGNPIVQIGIIVLSVFVVWATTVNPNQRFTVLFLIMNLIFPVITLIVVALVLGGLVWLICLMAGVRLSRKQFERYFFGIYCLVILLQLLTSLIETLAR
jgi:hypothetical protein